MTNHKPNKKKLQNQIILFLSAGILINVGAFLSLKFTKIGLTSIIIGLILLTLTIKKIYE